MAGDQSFGAIDVFFYEWLHFAVAFLYKTAENEEIGVRWEDPD